jgi:hypothetical protein
MYNPVNMQIEDAKRLHEKDLREKNKKARFEVKYDFEQNARKECLANFEHKIQQGMNKISGTRYKELTGRGFDILSNEKLEGPGVTIMMDQVSKCGPVKAWKKILLNANDST